jgi:hypothetical protein
VDHGTTCLRDGGHLACREQFAIGQVGTGEEPDSCRRDHFGFSPEFSLLEESIDVFTHPDGWRYENVTEKRRQWLLSPATLDLLLEQIIANTSIENVVLAEPCEESSADGISAHRIAFQARAMNPAATHAFDRLLNGACGLRARYAHSAAAGAHASGWVCRFLAHAVGAGRVAFANEVDKPSRASLRRHVTTSMAHPSAKVWFGPSVDRAASSVVAGVVSCTRWMQSRANPASISAQLSRDRFGLTDQQIAYLLGKGAEIPVPLSLDVKGGFRTRDGSEYVALSKRNRDLQLHLTGWT